jgi:RNase H-fold protein (predicted Holliday junction resolvase)
MGASDMGQTAEKKWVLAIDPGSDKVGFAVVFYDLSHGELGIAYLAEMQRVFKRFCAPDVADLPQAVVIGNGTAASVICRLYNDLGFEIPVRFAEERNTTLKARGRYFAEHPPTGLWKLVPLGLQMPPRPVDDYAAWLIGEKYLIEQNLAISPQNAA